MNKIIKSIVAFAMGLVAVACSSSDDMADDNKSLAVEGIPASITLDAGGQNMSRVSVGTWNDGMDGTKIDWEWEFNDTIYAVSKTTGKYVGRLVRSSWPDSENKNIAVFKTPLNEGLKVQDGETLVFWYLGRNVVVNSKSFAKDDKISVPKFDIANAVGGKLNLDFSIQPFNQKGSREIMSANDVIVVSNVDGKLQATNKNSLLVMKHHTSYTRARMFSPDNKIKYYGVNGKDGGTGWNWVYKVELKNVINKATLDLVNEDFLGKQIGDVELWNTDNTNNQATFDWTILPGEQEPQFTVQTGNDVFWEAKLPKRDVKKGEYIVDKHPDERVKADDVTRNYLHIMFDPCEVQPYNTTPFPAADYIKNGHDYSMVHTGALCSGNLLYSYNNYQYRYGLQIAKDVTHLNEENIYHSFPFLSSTTQSVPMDLPNAGLLAGLKGNQVIYNGLYSDDTRTPPIEGVYSEMSYNLNASSWSDFANYGETQGWDLWSYSFKYKLNIGNSYKCNRSFFLGFAESANTGRGIAHEHLHASYAVPSIDDFDTYTGQYMGVFVKIQGTDIEGLVIFPSQGDNDAVLSYVAGKLGIADLSKIIKLGSGFSKTADDKGRFKKNLMDLSEQVIVTKDALTKSNFVFFPLNPYGYKDFTAKVQHPEWTGLGVYQTSTINADKKPLAFFLAKEDGKLLAWYQAVEPTDFMFVRLMATTFWWNSADPKTRFFPRD